MLTTEAMALEGQTDIYAQEDHQVTNINWPVSRSWLKRCEIGGIHFRPGRRRNPSRATLKAPTSIEAALREVGPSGEDVSVCTAAQWCGEPEMCGIERPTIPRELGQDRHPHPGKSSQLLPLSRTVEPNSSQAILRDSNSATLEEVRLFVSEARTGLYVPVGCLLQHQPS